MNGEFTWSYTTMIYLDVLFLLIVYGLQHGKSLFFTIIWENRFGTFSGKSKGKVE